MSVPLHLGETRFYEWDAKEDGESLPPRSERSIAMMEAVRSVFGHTLRDDFIRCIWGERPKSLSRGRLEKAAKDDAARESLLAALSRADCTAERSGGDRQPISGLSYQEGAELFRECVARVLSAYERWRRTFKDARRPGTPELAYEQFENDQRSSRADRRRTIST